MPEEHGEHIKFDHDARFEEIEREYEALEIEIERKRWVLRDQLARLDQAKEQPL